MNEKQNISEPGNNNLEIKTDSLDIKQGISLRLSKVIGDRTGSSIATKVCCSRAAISKYLNGDISISILIFIKIAKEINISLDWLLLGEGEPVGKICRKTNQAVNGDIWQYVIAHLVEVCRGITALGDELRGLTVQSNHSGLNGKELNDKVEALRDKLLNEINYAGEIIREINKPF